MSSRIQVVWPLSSMELKPALEFALALERAPMGVLMLRDDQSGSLEPVITEGLTDEQSERFTAQRPGIGPVGVAFTEHRHVAVADAAADGNGFQDTLPEIARRVGFRGLDVVPLTLNDGSVIGAIAVLFRGPHTPNARHARLADIAGRLMALALDHARLRAAAEKRRETIETMSRARVQFVARMSHELRTPLQSITGYLDLLRLGATGQLSPQQTEMLDRVRKSELVLVSVIDDLGSLARLEAGRVQYRRGPIEVGEIVTIAEMVVTPLAQQRGVNLEIVPLDQPLVVMGDEQKLKQVLINLLTNAIKFTPRGGRARISRRADDANVYIEVADTGPGIPPNKLGDVFEPYVQLEQPAIDGLTGSGLGLAISREFMQGMGGELSVTSTVGEGCVFRACLPRHLEQPSSWRAPSANP